MTAINLKVSEILAERLAVLSAQDVESRRRTEEALASVRAMIRELEELDLDA
jgi:uncharacterized protein YdhG (YjbR/CyaY superfamily)